MAILTRKFGSEMLKLPDCGGLTESGKCRWLNISACAGIDCAYYGKAGSQELAKKRLRSLDEEKQERISQKYYRGARPWMEDASKRRRRDDV